MVKRNPYFEKLNSSYLFPEINKRKREFLIKNPTAKLISLGIGDTTEPISPTIHTALVLGAEKLGHRETYSGYGPEQGSEQLRREIATKFYPGNIQADEIFISDGAKCDIGRLQMLFGGQVSIALQDPAYPVYREGSLIQGVSKITLLPCTPENDFFPDLSLAKGVDLIYFCSPNNPTGAAATYAQLEELVRFARQNRSIIIYDSAYAAYITDPTLPRSIFEIEGAAEVALETSSFSKVAGFTGVRLGWTVVPKALRFEEGSKVHNDWSRLTSTIFNGASNIAQQGGIGVLDPLGWAEAQAGVAFYKQNGALLKTALQNYGLNVYGGVHAPYLWAHFPGRSSWDVFQEFLEHYHLVTTPGSGFGPAGEGFLRLTAFSSRETLYEAVERLSESSFTKSGNSYKIST